jgi:drug/metabolite transporter (DMT)-like permease
MVLGHRTSGVRAGGRHPAAGVLAAAASVVVWGASSVLIKQVHGVSGLAISFHRLWIGAVLTSAVFMLSGGRFSRRLLRLALPGGLAFGLDICLFFTAVKATSVANATVIGALQPVLILALARRLFGERPGLVEAFWACVAIGGAVIVVTAASDAGGASRRGDLLATAALVAWTWYFIASKRARTELTSLEYLAGLSLVAAVAVTPVVLLSGERLAVPELSGWLTIVAIACINGAIGHFLMNWAHAHVPIVVTSLMTLGIPVFATASAAVFIHESLSGAQVAGMVVVIVALAIVVARTTRDEPGREIGAAPAPEPVPDP